MKIVPQSFSETLKTYFRRRRRRRRIVDTVMGIIPVGSTYASMMCVESHDHHFVVG